MACVAGGWGLGEGGKQRCEAFVTRAEVERMVVCSSKLDGNYVNEMEPLEFMRARRLNTRRPSTSC